MAIAPMPSVEVLKNLAAWSQQQLKLNKLIKDLIHAESYNLISRATLRCSIIKDIRADAVVDQIGTRTFIGPIWYLWIRSAGSLCAL